ncbi:MAG: hypothetical protein NT124_00645 [Candidatus Dependentiae bacterium]|nr:hypothetical protein [Candidatus Dependentiae bacterium]
MKKVLLIMSLGLGIVGISHGSHSVTETLSASCQKKRTVTCHCGEINVVRPQFCNRCGARLDTSLTHNGLSHCTKECLVEKN